MKAAGDREWKENAKVKFENRMKELRQSLIDFGNKNEEETVKTTENNIETFFEFLENEPKTVMTKELPGDMYAVGINLINRAIYKIIIDFYLIYRISRNRQKHKIMIEQVF